MNEWLLSFSKQIDYRRYDEITLLIELISGPRTASVEAKLDSGSKYCIFQPRFVELLELDLASGTPQRF